MRIAVPMVRASEPNANLAMRIMQPNVHDHRPPPGTGARNECSDQKLRRFWNTRAGWRFVCIRLLSNYLFTRNLFGQKTSQASADTHNNQPKPEALERDQLTNPKSYCASETSSDRSGSSMFWTVPF